MKKQRCTVYLDIRDVQGLDPQSILTVEGTITDLKQGEWDVFTAFVELTHHGKMMLLRGGNSERLLAEEIMDRIAEQYAERYVANTRLSTIITNIDKGSIE